MVFVGVVLTLVGFLVFLAGDQGAHFSFGGNVPCVVEFFEIKDDPAQKLPFTANVGYHYEWEGKRYRGSQLQGENERSATYEWLAEAKVYALGSAPLCAVNVLKPEESSLKMPNRWSFSWSGMFMLAGGMFLLMAGYGKIRRGWAISSSGVENKDVYHWVFPLSLSVTFIGGTVMMGLVLPHLWSWKAIQSWKETSANVVWSRASESGVTSQRPEIFYRYVFEAQEHFSNRASYLEDARGVALPGWSSFDQFPPGTVLSCFVNPLKPHQATLSKKLDSGDMLMTLFSTTLLVTGLWSLKWTRRKHQHAEAKRTTLATPPPSKPDV